MTYTEIVSADIPIDNTPMSCLMVQSALEWMQENTTISFDIFDIESIKALPFGAKLFILKYVEAMSMGAGVTSESISGLSQSFDSISKGEIIRQYARNVGKTKFELLFWLAKSVHIPERAFLRGGFDSCHKRVVDRVERAFASMLTSKEVPLEMLKSIGRMLATQIKTYAV